MATFQGGGAGLQHLFAHRGTHSGGQRRGWEAEGTPGKELAYGGPLAHAVSQPSRLAGRSTSLVEWHCCRATTSRRGPATVTQRSGFCCDPSLDQQASGPSAPWHKAKGRWWPSSEAGPDTGAASFGPSPPPHRPAWPGGAAHRASAPVCSTFPAFCRTSATPGSPARSLAASGGSPARWAEGRNSALAATTALWSKRSRHPVGRLQQRSLPPGGRLSHGRGRLCSSGTGGHSGQGPCQSPAAPSRELGACGLCPPPQQSEGGALGLLAAAAAASDTARPAREWSLTDRQPAGPAAPAPMPRPQPLAATPKGFPPRPCCSPPPVPALSRRKAHPPNHSRPASPTLPSHPPPARLPPACPAAAGSRPPSLPRAPTPGMDERPKWWAARAGQVAGGLWQLRPLVGCTWVGEAGAVAPMGRLPRPSSPQTHPPLIL